MRTYLWKLKRHENESFSFPNSTANLTDEIIDENRMRLALARFAKKLVRQLQKTRKNLVAVDILGIEFKMIFGGTRSQPCANPLGGRARLDATAGHCGHCEVFRKKKR